MDFHSSRKGYKIDLSKAFDKVRLSDVVDILRKKHVPKTIIDIIRQLNLNTSTHILIRQEGSLSQILFNLILDEIINHFKNIQ